MMRKLLAVLFLFLSGQILAQSTPALGHVVVVALENHSYSDVVGNPAMPYLNGLISQYGLAKGFYADVHGSFPDYAMLTTGELITQTALGLPDDFPISIDNLARELTNRGKSWKAYAENLPSAAYTGGDLYPYVKRHNPFAYTSDVLNSASQANNLVPFSQFATDLGANALPNFSFVVPNAEDDGEDCPGGGSSCQDSLKLSTTDQWLQTNIAPLLTNPQFQQNGLLVIWWDEGNASDNANGGGQVAVVFAGPTIKRGYSSSTFYRHENLLRTIAEGLGLGFPGASIYVTSMAEFFGPNTTPGSLAGHVSDASSGAALAGATVSFSGGSTTADSNGNYSFTKVASGAYSVTASDSGYSSQTSLVTVSPATASTLNFQLSVVTGPGTISGHVTNISTGGAISGATVSYSGGSTTSDSSGAYSFTNVAAGTYNLTVSHSGYFKLTQSVTVSSGTTSTLNLALATGGIVAGRVTNSSGVALAGAAVNLSGGAISTTMNTTTNSAGNYTSNWVPVGSYTVTVSASGFSTQSKTANITTGNTVTLNFAMASVTGGTVAGTVTNSSGAAIAGAAVNLSGGPISTTVNTTTNSNGGYSSGQVPVGTYTMTASAAGFTAQSQAANVTLGNTLTLNFVMAANNSVVPASNHVFLVVLENRSYESVFPSGCCNNPPTSLTPTTTYPMPYLYQLAHNNALAAGYYAESHYSIPNYMWLTAGTFLTYNDSIGSTASDLTAANTIDTPNGNVVRSLLAAGKTWKAYAESLPYAGYMGYNVDATNTCNSSTGCTVKTCLSNCTASYVKRHNPFAYFTDVANVPAQANNVVPWTQFASDNANCATNTCTSFANYNFIVANLADDAHDGTPQSADLWLQNNVKPVLDSSPMFQPGGDGVMVITFDESFNDYSLSNYDCRPFVATSTNPCPKPPGAVGGAGLPGGGHVPTVIVGPKVKPNYVSSSNFYHAHESVMKMMMEALGLTPTSSYPMGAATADELGEFFTQAAPTASSSTTRTSSH